jgi:hypothetical protein
MHSYPAPRPPLSERGHDTAVILATGARPERAFYRYFRAARTFALRGAVIAASAHSAAAADAGGGGASEPGPAIAHPCGDAESGAGAFGLADALPPDVTFPAGGGGAATPRADPDPAAAAAAAAASVAVSRRGFIELYTSLRDGPGLGLRDALQRVAAVATAAGRPRFFLVPAEGASVERAPAPQPPPPPPPPPPAAVDEQAAAGPAAAPAGDSECEEACAVAAGRAAEVYRAGGAARLDGLARDCAAPGWHPRSRPRRAFDCVTYFQVRPSVRRRGRGAVAGSSCALYGFI